MTRAAAMTAVSALCLLWTAGCAGTDTTKSAATAKPVDSTIADGTPDAHADAATLTKNLPVTLDGEIRRAQLLRAKGDYDEAARSLAQMLLVAPDDGRIVGEYGKVLEQQGQSKEALPFLKRAAQLSPNEWSVQSALGVAYDQLDDHASARGAYERALALNPSDASILNNYAVSRMLAGDYVAAKRLFLKAEAIGGANPKIAGNLEKLAALAPQPAPAGVSSPLAPRTTAPVPVQVSVSPAPARAIVSVAASGSRASTNSNTVAASASTVSPKPNTTVAAATQGQAKVGRPALTRVAVAGPKALGGQVVMERVPADPLAGPVHHAAPKPAPATKLASTAKKAQPAVKKTLQETPSLRTAADAN